MCVCLIFFIWNAYFLKKTNYSSNYYLLWMNAPEKTNSVGEWRVSPEHRVGGNWAGVLGVALEREGGFEGCPRAVSLRLKPPLTNLKCRTPCQNRHDYRLNHTPRKTRPKTTWVKAKSLKSEGPHAILGPEKRKNERETVEMKWREPG